MISLKKKVEEMTPEEALKEMEKVLEKLENLAPKVVGDWIKMSKFFYAHRNDEAFKKALATDKELRRELFEYASVVGDLEQTLLKVEDFSRQKLEELEKKRKDKDEREKHKSS